MFTAKFDEPFTLTGFVRTSWLIGKRVVICIFFFNKKFTTRLSIYCVSLFLFIFNKKNCRLSFKIMHDCFCGQQELLKGASTWILNLFIGGLYSQSYLWGSNSGLIVPSQVLIFHKFTYSFPLFPAFP